MWLFDYPLLERIYDQLAVSFDAFGNVTSRDKRSKSQTSIIPSSSIKASVNASRSAKRRWLTAPNGA